VELARRLAADGAAVVVNHHDERSAGAAADLVARIEADGGEALALQADVGAEDAVTAMAEQAVARFGPVTLLVNNAATAVAESRAWHEWEAADWDTVTRTNVTAGFLVARALRASFDPRGGSIVNISSIRAITGKPGNLPYTATKAAQIGFTRALARELGPLGVRVNALLVGAILTAGEGRYGSLEEVDAEVLAAQALNRRGLPADVAGVVAFLCGEEAAFITGQTLAVDGGWVLD
jgi:3-oxoacyl-[acyl-carrier protein] reductase